VESRSQYIQTEDALFHYLVFGDGPETLLAFHGFGDDGSLFTKLPALAENYTVHAFDMPFHGHTLWPVSKAFQRGDILSVIRTWQKDNQVEAFDLMGYSMGGKVALSVFPEFHQQISKLILIAADGLDMPFYRRITFFDKLNFAMLRKLFHFDFVFHSFLEVFYRLKMINSYSYRFSKKWMRTTKHRKERLQLWYSMRSIIPQSKLLNEIIDQDQTEVQLYWGKEDKVIPIAPAEKWAANSAQVDLASLDEDHLIIGENLNREILKATSCC